VLLGAGNIRSAYLGSIHQEQIFMGQWIEVAAEADVLEGVGFAVEPEGHEIALFSVDGEVFATNNQCTHGLAMLCDGVVEGPYVECPFHQGRFDVRTGACVGGPVTEPVKSWPVKVEAGRVWLDLS